jgi:hypothetical protein
MSINLADVAQDAAQTLTGLAVTDAWSLVRTRIRRIFGSHAGTEITSAAEAAGADRPSDIERLVLSHLHGRIDRAIALLVLIDDFAVTPAVGPSIRQRATAKGGTVIQAGRDVIAPSDPDRRTPAIHLIERTDLD